MKMIKCKKAIFKFLSLFMAALLVPGTASLVCTVNAVNILEAEEKNFAASGATVGDAIELKSSKKWIDKTIGDENTGYHFKIRIYNESVITINTKNTLKSSEIVQFWNLAGESGDSLKYSVNAKSSKKFTFCVEPGTYVLYCGRSDSGDSGSISVNCRWKKYSTPYDKANNNGSDTAVDISKVKNSINAMLAVGDKGDFYKVTYDNYALKGIQIKNSVADSTKIIIYDATDYLKGHNSSMDVLDNHGLKKGETYKYNLSKKEGTLYISVSGGMNGKYTLTPIWNVTSKSITITGKNITVSAGETKKIITGVTPSNASEDSYCIKSSNTSIVGVASNKSITGCKKGKAKITIYYGRDYNQVGQVYKHKIECSVTVTEADIKKITPEKNSVIIEKGGKYTCSVTLTPKNASKKDLTYKSSNTKVAKVTSKGVVTGVAPGSAVITIRSKNNSKVKATINVSVGHIIKSVSISKTQLNLKKGSTATLTASVSPTGTKYNSVKWSSSNTGVATVNQNGLVTAVGNGKAYITATSTENPGAKASCAVTVGDSESTVDVTGISISPSGTTVSKGNSASLSASLSPQGASGTVSWSIADSSIASISSNGNTVTVTGKNYGTTYLTASIGGVKKTVSITVQ